MTASPNDLTTLAAVKTLLGLPVGADSFIESIVPADYSSTVTGATADRNGFTTTEIVFQFGVVDTPSTLSITKTIVGSLQESDNGSTWTTVAASNISGTLPTLDDDSDDNQNYVVSYLGVKRYLRAIVTFAAGAPGIEISVMIRLVAAGNYDAVLQSLITASSFAIMNLTGTDFITQARVEDYPWDEIVGRLIVTQAPANYVIGGVSWRALKLRHKPIVSITSIVDPAGNTITQYEIQKSRGVIEATWTPPMGLSGLVAYWTVTYTTGLYASTAAITDTSIGQACAETVKDWFSRRSAAGRIASKSIGDASLSYDYGQQTSGQQLWAIPTDAAALLAPYMNYCF